jgi:hypothetical protein
VQKIKPGKLCSPQIIRYGNMDTQMAKHKAILNFEFNKGEKSKVTLLVVERQNEDIILGMDWLENENIILIPKTKSIKKMAEQYCNSTEVIESLLKEFTKLTEETEFQTLTSAPYEHRIDTGDVLPTVSRDYRRSEMERQAMAKEVETMLERKVIIPSNSDWFSPVVLIKKPDGTFRFCVDYRALNKITIKDKYPLPNITDLLDRLHGMKYFSTIDLNSGYWQLPLDPKDMKKTAFIADGSRYEFTCLPFGDVLLDIKNVANN